MPEPASFMISACMIMASLCIAPAFVLCEIPPGSRACEVVDWNSLNQEWHRDITMRVTYCSKSRSPPEGGLCNCKYKLSPSHLPTVHPHAPARFRMSHCGLGGAPWCDKLNLPGALGCTLVIVCEVSQVAHNLERSVPPRALRASLESWSPLLSFLAPENLVVVRVFLDSSQEFLDVRMWLGRKPF